MRVSRCPQAAILRCACAAQPALLLSAQGLDVHVWRAGRCLRPPAPGAPPCKSQHSRDTGDSIKSHPHTRVSWLSQLQLHLPSGLHKAEMPHGGEAAASMRGGEEPAAMQRVLWSLVMGEQSPANRV